MGADQTKPKQLGHFGEVNLYSSRLCLRNYQGDLDTKKGSDSTGSGIKDDNLPSTRFSGYQNKVSKTNEISSSESHQNDIKCNGGLVR